MTMQMLSIEPRGRSPLWMVFWIYGVLVSHLFFGAILYFYRQIGTPLLALSLAGFVAYTAWIMRAVWVNAFNVEKEIYGHIARALTVAWAINAVLVSGFLFLGHLGAVTLPI
ncbi:MAG: hypothetical protein ACYC42_07275 [Lysobacter sp.]